MKAGLSCRFYLSFLLSFYWNKVYKKGEIYFTTFYASIFCLNLKHHLGMASLIFFLLVSLLYFAISYGLRNKSSEYENNCIRKESRIDCMFFVSTNWSFLEFRYWLDEIEGNITEVKSIQNSSVWTEVVYFYPIHIELANFD